MHRQLIEIARVVIVDRAPQRIAHIPNRGIGCRPRNGIEFTDGGIGKIGQQAAPQHDIVRYGCQ